MSENLRILATEADVEATPGMDDAIDGTVDWFEGESSMPTEDFIDRLCKDYGHGWDIERLDTPAVRLIMRWARANRRERG